MVSCGMKEGVKYVAFVIVIVGLLLGSRWMNQWKHREYKVASGKPGAGYQAFTKGVLDVCDKANTSLKVSSVETEGSIENLKLIEAKEVDFGLVQQGVRLSDSIRAVAPIYNDVVHLLVRKDAEITDLSGWRGKQVSLGLASSGTRVIGKQLFDHYGIDLSELDVRELEPQVAVKKMISGELDAMLMVTALRAPIIQEVLASGKVEHMSMGSPDVEAGVTHGVSSQYLHLQPMVIPAHAFGKRGGMAQPLPQSPVSVLSVPSLLVCHEEVPNEAVYAMTKALYAHRYTLGRYVPEALKMRELETVDRYSYPLHEGAEEYYRRKDPNFLVVYAEVIALLLSGVIALVGMVSAVRKWSERRQKNRIDVYYMAINASLKGLERGEVKDLDAEEEKLIALKHKAFDELVDERLTADESFRIFQDLLEQCLHEVERQKASTC